MEVACGRPVTSSSAARPHTASRSPSTPTPKPHPSQAPKRPPSPPPKKRHLGKSVLPLGVLGGHLGAHTDAALDAELDQEGGIRQEALTETCRGSFCWEGEGGCGVRGSEGVVHHMMRRRKARERGGGAARSDLVLQLALSHCGETGFLYVGACCY